MAEGKGRRCNVGKGRENLVFFSGDIGGVEARGHARKILRAREKGADDRLRVSVSGTACFYFPCMDGQGRQPASSQ